MYNASTASPTVPTSPTTPTSTPHNNAPPPAATATQPDTATPPSTTAAQATPTPAPQQPQPKKNLSLTVRTASCTELFLSMAFPLPDLQLSSFCFVFFPHYRENRCTQRRKCLRLQTKSPDLRKLLSWVSWQDQEVL